MPPSVTSTEYPAVACCFSRRRPHRHYPHDSKMLNSNSFLLMQTSCMRRKTRQTRNTLPRISRISRIQLHRPAERTRPPLILHKRPALQTIPAYPALRSLKRRGTLTPETRPWRGSWKIGCRLLSAESLVLRYGLRRLLETAGLAGQEVERVVQRALRTCPLIWIGGDRRSHGRGGRGCWR
jgi:hypothetical protein